MQKLKLSELHYYGNEVLTKEQMKKVLGGLASGTCGNVLTQTNGDRCVDGNISQATAKQNSSDYNQGTGVYSQPGYGAITDVNWCCASCGNFSACGDIDV